MIPARRATLLVLAACACGDGPESGERTRVVPPDSSALWSPPDTGAAIRTHMHGVHFHLPHDIVLDVRDIRGTMHATAKDQPVTFDDVRSFALTIESGEVAITMEQLGRLMNDWVFADGRGNLEDIAFEVRDGRLRQTGTLDKGIDIGFEVVATPSLDPDGSIRIHPESIRALGPVGGPLMDLLGLELDDLVDLGDAPGITVDENDLIIDPHRILPPPAMRGTISALRLEENALVQVFGEPAGSAAAGTGNFMAFTGGTVRFGKLQMTDTDMRVVDMDPDDPFDFSIVHYHEQLVAGSSHTQKDHGLVVFMPDLDDLRRDGATSR